LAEVSDFSQGRYFDTGPFSTFQALETGRATSIAQATELSARPPAHLAHAASGANSYFTCAAWRALKP
jgi:hypothetical protein